MHEVLKKVNVVFCLMAACVTGLALRSSPCYAGAVEGFVTQGSRHWGLSAVVHRKFKTQTHLTENEIAQAKARDLDAFIDADSPFGWVIGVGALRYELENSRTPALKSALNQSLFLGLTAETETSWFFDLTIAMDRNSKLQAANNGIDFKVSYIVEWARIKSTFHSAVDEVASILPSNSDDEVDRKSKSKRKKKQSAMAEEDERLRYPYTILTLNPFLNQHGRKWQTGEEYFTTQTGFMFSGKYFHNERWALKGTYGTFIYQKGEPKDFYAVGEVKGLIPVRAGPVGASALIRSFPKHYASFVAQVFSALHWETEWGFSRTSFHHKEIETVYSPNVGVFRMLKGSQSRIGGTIDIFKGGMSGYSLGVHFTRFW